MARHVGRQMAVGGLLVSGLSVVFFAHTKKVPASAQGGAVRRGVVHRRGSDGTQALTPYGWRVRIRAISGRCRKGG